MRDVNSGWAIRYTHANVASFFFIFVYAHIARGLYYGSYKAPRVLVWSIGVIILIVMMAKIKLWPNCEYEISDIVYCNCILGKMLPFNKARTKSLERIGPHNKQILDLIICGMLGDFWCDLIKGKKSNSVRFNIEQSISNSSYIHYLTFLFYNLGYCVRPVPILVHKSDKTIKNRFNYRLSLFAYSNLVWIFYSFYINVYIYY